MGYVIVGPPKYRQTQGPKPMSRRNGILDQYVVSIADLCMSKGNKLMEGCLVWEEKET